MKKVIFSLLLALPFGVMAQEATEQPAAEVAEQTQQPQVARFGYLSYNAVYEQMPEFAKAKESFAELKKKYEAEATRFEEEFQRKFAEFLHGQKDFPASIMQKRQAELQELMEKSTKFRRESRELLKKAEDDMHKPLLDRLNEALKAVGAEQGFMFILNTDGNTLPFINPAMGVDVTEAILIKLGIKTN
ncbi:MAG: OmpH family outer membrane protein [Bacteroidaceae bacterium]|nr:OmpH family outer membrane protein [Bacteroidaceae bacterium]